MQSQLQGSVNSSAMFLTAAAQNLLCMKLAAEMGVAVPNAWVTWVKASGSPAGRPLACCCRDSRAGMDLGSAARAAPWPAGPCQDYL